MYGIFIANSQSIKISKSHQEIGIPAEKENEKKYFCPMEIVMAFVEILKFGKPARSMGGTPVMLGRSSGINQDLADEIVRLCKGWGKPPSGENLRPVIMSFPLKARSKSLPGDVFAVLKVEAGSDPGIQAVVLSNSDYSSYGYNPFAVAQAGAFPLWDSETVSGRRTIQKKQAQLIISPPPSPEDVGLVDEALHQLLVSHKLYLPIGNPTEESDRCLALLLEVIPEAMKKQLRFASFAPSPANGYHLAATATQGCEFIGWRRLMMTLVGGALTNSLETYVKQVRDCLAFGDISVIREDNRLVSLGAASSSPQASETRPHASANQGVVTAATKTVAQASPRQFQQTQQRVTRPKGKRSISKPTPQLAHLRGGRRQLPGAVVVLLVLVLTAGGGWTYLEFFHGGGGIPWSELVTLPEFLSEQGKDRVASLLEVPNVGAVYTRQIKRISRAELIPGLSPETDQRRGLVQLKEDAAVPLLQQVDLFLELAGAGINQGKRTDRENERMRSLTSQGQVLAVELARLELAWHSLSLGVNWQDLGHLSDLAVLARRDSLHLKSAAALRVAAEDMKFGKRRDRLLYSLEQVRGMSQLLTLFEADHWSDQWSKDLFQAAETVSPSVSPMTRAYRNSAFALVRLKNAEHSPFFAASAFSATIDNNYWPSSEVADILPGLRKQVGKFGDNAAPPLLAGTMALYQLLENPKKTVSGLASGQNQIDRYRENAAVQFDPEVYENYLQRLHYQAVQQCIQSGAECSSLGSESVLANLASFAEKKSYGLTADQWDAWSRTQENPFLQRWAHHEVAQREQKLQIKRSEFGNHCQDVWTLVQEVKAKAGKGANWSENWVSLVGKVAVSWSLGQELLVEDPSISHQLDELENLRKALRQSHLLDLGTVTVRLDQSAQSEPTEVVFEYRVLPEGRILRSQPFLIGPAAPAGSGWVGTVILNRSSNVASWTSFQGKVRSITSGQELLVVHYPSLEDGGGPGELSRPKSGPGGNLRIKMDENWWKNVRLPQKDDGAGVF